jgi:hypothetical protein
MTALVLFLALAAAPPPAGCAPQFAPLETGSSVADSRLPVWRKTEAGQWNGRGWVGWNWQGDALRPVRLVVRDRPKEPRQEEGEVSVKSIPDVSFAVRCIPQLRAGRIQATPVANESLEPGHALKISLNSRHYELRLESARPDLFDAVVILTDGRRRQVLYSTDGFADEPHFDIVWAGDLDRDGRLDLVVNLDRKYSWHPYRLLLSSKASARQLVGEAAIFETGD